MSNTPRTDKEEYYNDREGESVVSSEFARTLERENDEMAKRCVTNVEEIGQLRADAARLAWWLAGSVRFQDRDEIDAAMEAQNDED